MADTNTRQGKRTPVTLKIKFKSETLEQFIERYAVDVSQGGIFIRTKDPLAVGTQMKFEFQLRDASPLIAGEGTVVWTRENDPSRPAIAPGMGVRFDRLADGSQTVLEKILAEKAKQAPSRSGTSTAPGDSAKAAMFTDTPTRVAPAPVQEALGMRSRNRADSESTPLPRPMPFQSDAEDFDERAFEEATKVRSLDELALHSAGLDTGDDPLADGPGNMTAIMPPDELAIRRQAGRADSTLADPPLAAPPDEARPTTKTVPDRDSAPSLPSAPAVEPARPRADATPAAGLRQSQNQPASELAGSTKLGIEPNKAQTSQARVQGSESAVPRSVAAEPSRPAAPQRPSSAPVVIGILVIVAAAIGAVWWFALRDKVADEVADTKKPDTGSAVVVNNGGSAGSAIVETGSGSDVAMTGSAGSGSAVGAGSDAGSATAMTGTTGGSATAAAAIVDTVITAPSAKGATVEILGTAMKGQAPFTAKLEKDKAYKARVTAAGFNVSEVDVKGGQKTTAKLVMKPRTVMVTTDPPGASIYVDNIDTGKVSPSDVTLSAAQAARPRVRISMRRVGFRPVDMTVEATAFQDDSGRMVTSIESKLTAQQIVRPPTGGNTGTTGTGTGTGTGSAATGTGTGSAATGTGTGSAATGTGTGTTGTGTGSATTTPTPPPTTTPTPAPTPLGGGTGSATKPAGTGSGAQPPATSL